MVFIMNKLQFKHIASGVAVTVNGHYLGIFDSEKDAISYLILNDYIDNLYIERFSE